MVRRKQCQKILFAFFCLLILLCAFLTVCFPHTHVSLDSDCHVCFLQEFYRYGCFVIAVSIALYSMLWIISRTSKHHVFSLHHETLVESKVKLSQ